MDLDKIEIIELGKDFKESVSFIDYYDYRRPAWEELDPENPTLSFEDFKNEWMANDSETYETFMYALKHEGNFIGNFWLNGIKKNCTDAPQAEKGVGYFQCFVPKELRRQGIATMQLKKVANLARDWGFKKINCTWCEQEAAKEFCRHFSGVMVSKDTRRKFNLKDANWDNIKTFACHTDKNSDFTTEFAIGYPQDRKLEFMSFLASFANEFSRFENDEPWDEDFLVKGMQEDEGKRDGKEINIFAIAKDGAGRFAGVTEVTIENISPEFAYQGITGVAKNFRGNGLGLRLKAEMALHIRDNYPAVEKISTITSNENKWMIVINEAMGYKLYKQVERYCFNVGDLAKRMGANNESE